MGIISVCMYVPNIVHCLNKYPLNHPFGIHPLTKFKTEFGVLFSWCGCQSDGFEGNPL